MLLLSKLMNLPFIYETKNFISILLVILLIITTSLIFFTKKSSKGVFLVDFSCYKPPQTLKCSRETVLDRATKLGYSADSVSFMAETMQVSGVGDSTAIPENIMSVPQDLSMEAARNESEMVVFGAIDLLLEKTKVDCSEIGILIVNCTVFNPIPSLSSMIVNRYKFRDNICSYNLSGMGCVAGLGAVGLANQLLQVHQNTCALIVSTENITSSVYAGNDPSRLIFNCLFRPGGAAVLLSNKPSLRRRSTYELLHAVHTHTASSDVAYKCIRREEDADGITSITTQNLTAAASSAIEQHLKKLGPLILPLSDQLLVAKNCIARRLRPRKATPAAYIPKFGKCVDHFLPHVGAKPVLDLVEKKLGFCGGDMEASRMTLHWFGNTSSSSIWYELAYIEAKGRVKRGDRVWQIAYGSGFKCSSLILKAMRDVEVDDEMNPWTAEIDQYPVDLDTSASFLNLFEPSN